MRYLYILFPVYTKKKKYIYLPETCEIGKLKVSVSDLSTLHLGRVFRLSRVSLISERLSCYPVTVSRRPAGHMCAGSGRAPASVCAALLNAGRAGGCRSRRRVVVVRETTVWKAGHESRIPCPGDAFHREGDGRCEEEIDLTSGRACPPTRATRAQVCGNEMTHSDDRGRMMPCVVSGSTGKKMCAQKPGQSQAPVGEVIDGGPAQVVRPERRREVRPHARVRLREIIFMGLLCAATRELSNDTCKCREECGH